MAFTRTCIFCLTFFVVVSLSAKDYALFFAVEDYDHMGKLTNPVNNANAIAKELVENFGFQTEVIANPTFDQIAMKIAEYQKKFTSGAYDQKGQLLIFFSGHGIQRGENGYFVPTDGNPSKLYERVVEYDNWRYEIDQIDCQHILVIIDACYSITFDPNWKNKADRDFGRRGEATKDQILMDHKNYRARLFFTSDGQNDQTPDRSTLAKQFLTGLRTYRSVNNYLPASELYASFLRRAAPLPGGGDFGSDEPGSRFLFFRKYVDIPQDTRTDFAAWEGAKAKNSCAAYQEYLRDFANGDFVAVARKLVAACKAEEEMLAAWIDAKRLNTYESYQLFMSAYPQSPYFQTAELARNEHSDNLNSDGIISKVGSNSIYNFIANILEVWGVAYFKDFSPRVYDEKLYAFIFGITFFMPIIFLILYYKVLDSITRANISGWLTYGLSCGLLVVLANFYYIKKESTRLQLNLINADILGFAAITLLWSLFTFFMMSLLFRYTSTHRRYVPF